MDDRGCITARFARAAALATLALAAWAPLASAAPADALQGTKMRDRIYCEVFTVELQPSPVATVWNSLGFHDCPPDWWGSLDTTALAAEHDADLALLNGPRNFVVDSAVGKVYGATETFAGRRMRNVASIDLATVGLAAPPPLTEVKITRRNTWRWGAGKRVFELVGPNGRVYTMQSYSRQKDPALTFSQLASLGPRLGLPDGWTYRVRRPSENIVLFTNGAATVLQDSLGNTYQRLPVGLAG